MSEHQKIMEKVEGILDELVANAEELVKVSSQKAEEAELEPLQKKQEELIKELNECEKIMQRAPKNAMVHTKIHQKLQAFVKLNDKFVENIMATHGVIKFDAKKKREELDKMEDV